MASNTPKITFHLSPIQAAITNSPPPLSGPPPPPGSVPGMSHSGVTGWFGTASTPGMMPPRCDDFIEIIFSPSLDPADWVEKKSAVDLDGDVLTYLRGLVRHAFPAYSTAPFPVSPADVADFVRAEWLHALTLQPPLIQRGFNKRAILSSMHPHIDVQRRVGELQQQAVRTLMQLGTVTKAVDDDRTPPVPYVAGPPVGNPFSSVNLPPVDFGFAQGEMAPCYVCSHTMTSRRSQGGVPLCAKCAV